MKIKELTGGRFGVYYDDGRLRCVYPTRDAAERGSPSAQPETKARRNLTLLEIAVQKDKAGSHYHSNNYQKDQNT